MYWTYSMRALAKWTKLRGSHSLQVELKFNLLQMLFPPTRPRKPGANFLVLGMVTVRILLREASLKAT